RLVFAGGAGSPHVNGGGALGIACIGREESALLSLIGGSYQGRHVDADPGQADGIAVQAAVVAGVAEGDVPAAVDVQPRLSGAFEELHFADVVAAAGGIELVEPPITVGDVDVAENPAGLDPAPEITAQVD